jgi:hypothetical protein
MKLLGKNACSFAMNKCLFFSLGNYEAQNSQIYTCVATNTLQVKFDILCSGVGAGHYTPSAPSATIPDGSDPQGTAGK